MTIARDLLASILVHAREVYPAECCGLLIGRRDEGGVTRVERMVNRARAADRYEIDPVEFCAVDKTTWGTEEEIIGFYHSHPDHPPVPSVFDAECAWPSYWYLIVSITADGTYEHRLWMWTDAAQWHEKPMTILPSSL